MRLPRAARLARGWFLAAAALGYCAVVLLAYLELTSPSSIVPDLRTLDAALFGSAEPPVSAIERLIESTDGPMNGGGSMRPAFFQESAGWAALIENMTDEQRAELHLAREAERLALLGWVRSGANRGDYERDDFGGVKIKTLINDRCATCHSEEGRNDKARWFPLDAYEKLEPYCQPESIERPRLQWTIASLALILPLAMFAGPIFYRTRTSGIVRVVLLAIPPVAILVALVCWLLGGQGGGFARAILAAAGVAAAAVLIQVFASLKELFSRD